MPEWNTPLRARLAGLKLHPAREAEIIEELSVHLDDRYEELRREGLPAAEAQRLAVGELSDDHVLAAGLGTLKQAHTAELPAFGAPKRRWLADFWQDLVYGLRRLRHQPGFTAAAIVTLALGIGANTAIFSLIEATLFQRLPVADSARLLYVHNGASPGAVFSYPEFAEMRDANDVFDGFACWAPIAASLNADGETDLVNGVIVSGNYFTLLDVTAAQGRTLLPADDVTPGAHRVAVIGDRLWRMRFDSRPDIVGHQILLNGQPFTIVGVMPPGFGGAQIGVTRDLYVPMMMQALIRPPRAGFSGDMNPDLLKVRGNSWIFAMGRMRPGLTKERVEAALTTFATARDRTLDPKARPHPITTSRADDGVPGQRAQMIPVARLLLSVVGAVLLIACANVANLLLSRAAARRREIAVRLAIGASRWRIVRQFLTESVLLSVMGGAAGVLLAWLVVQAFRAVPAPPGALPIALDFSLNLRVLAFSAALSVLTGIVFGLAPAVRASRPTLVPALKDDSAVAGERFRRFELRKIFIVAEVALALALLITAGLFVRSLMRTQSIDPGFDVDHLVTAPLQVNLLRYTKAQGREFYEQTVERVRALPGVRAASVARLAPTLGSRISSLQIEGRTGSDNRSMSENLGAGASAGRNRTEVNVNVVGRQYFDAMGIALLRGRDFSTSDVEGAPLVVIVNQAFADLHFPGEEPIGRRLSVSGPNGPWREIVGISADSKYASLAEDRTAIGYLPISQNHETGVTLFVRTSGNPATLVGAVRREIQSLEPNLPVPNVQPMADTIGTSLYVPRLGAWLFAVLGGLALLLASVGVYGVLAFSISRRTRELGIRVALGAERRAVFALVIREGMTLVAIGVAVGLAASAGASRFLGQFLYGIRTTDPLTFASVPIVLLAVALLACLVPARRATRVDPTVALRES
jgi:predicted permease